jgi:hypothetical protein
VCCRLPPHFPPCPPHGRSSPLVLSLPSSSLRLRPGSSRSLFVSVLRCVFNWRCDIPLHLCSPSDLSSFWLCLLLAHPTAVSLVPGCLMYLRWAAFLMLLHGFSVTWLVHPQIETRKCSHRQYSTIIILYGSGRGEFNSPNFGSGICILQLMAGYGSSLSVILTILAIATSTSATSVFFGIGTTQLAPFAWLLGPLVQIPV